MFLPTGHPTRRFWRASSYNLQRHCVGGDRRTRATRLLIARAPATNAHDRGGGNAQPADECVGPGGGGGVDAHYVRVVGWRKEKNAGRINNLVGSVCNTTVIHHAYASYTVDIFFPSFCVPNDTKRDQKKKPRLLLSARVYNTKKRFLRPISTHTLLQHTTRARFSAKTTSDTIKTAYVVGWLVLPSVVAL